MTSSRVRRARLSFGDLTGGFGLRACFFTGFFADRVAGRRLGRLAERALDLAFFRAGVGLARRGPFRFAMLFVLSEP